MCGDAQTAEGALGTLDLLPSHSPSRWGCVEQLSQGIATKIYF